jgi:hypothetical protein
MSRGFGRVQRAIIDTIQGTFSASPRELAIAIFGSETPATRASISRALRPLIAAGYVNHHGRSWVCADRKLFKVTRRGCKALELWRSDGNGGFDTPMHERVYPRNASAKQRAALRIAWRRYPSASRPEIRAARSARSSGNSRSFRRST